MTKQEIISKDNNAMNLSSSPSRFLEVNGSLMHYVEQGCGQPILFIHGMPSSSYVWRSIIPHLTPYGRCIAVDLIGHGKSDSPQIEFSIENHLDYLTKFIEKLNLEDILIVGHSWGATLGIAYAKAHEKNIRGMSYFEPMLGSWKKWEDFNPYNPQAQALFKKFRAEDGWDLIVNQNIFLEQVFTNASVRSLSPEEREYYLRPFQAVERRKAAWKAPQELPIEGSPKDVVEMVEDNFRWQKETRIPQLFFYTKPAAFFTIERVKEFVQSASAVSLIYLGTGVYNHAEDYSYEIGKGIGEWLVNHYILDRAIPKFSLYTNIHKAIRKEIFEVCLLVSSSDFYDKKEIELLEQRLTHLFTLLRDHSKHEETFIHPLLSEKGLAEFYLLNNEHQELEKQLIHLERLFARIKETDNKTMCLECSNHFNLELCQFTSDYLQHLFFEEKEIMNILNNHYDLSELIAVMDKFKKSQSFEETMFSLERIFAAISPGESLFLLTTMQKTVPHELFIKIYQLAKSIIAESHWEKIEAQFLSEKHQGAKSI